MSFTGDIKSELCKTPVNNYCCTAAECFGMLLYANKFGSDEVRIQSDSVFVRKRVQLILKSAFGVETETDLEHKNTLFVSEKEDIGRIFAGFGYEMNNTALHLNRALVEEECCKNAFLRGAFLSSGYASAMEKGYHLELVTPHYNLSRQVMSLLLDMGFSPGFLVRRGNYVLYFKDSGIIEDFLSAIGATNSAMTLMLQKVEKALRNKVNRKVNCETANLSKTVDAAAKQIEAIKVLKNTGMFEQLPKNLRYTAEIRLNNPELSLSEMTQLFSPPLSRPGLNNRMRKIIQLSCPKEDV